MREHSLMQRLRISLFDLLLIVYGVVITGIAIGYVVSQPDRPAPAEPYLPIPPVAHETVAPAELGRIDALTTCPDLQVAFDRWVTMHRHSESGADSKVYMTYWERAADRFSALKCGNPWDEYNAAVKAGRLS